MRCHYVYDKKAGKVLIPGCWGATIWGMKGCTCPKEPETFEQFENKQYLEKLAELQRELHGMEQAYARAQRIIRQLIMEEDTI